MFLEELLSADADKVEDSHHKAASFEDWPFDSKDSSPTEAYCCHILGSLMAGDLALTDNSRIALDNLGN